MHQNRYRWNRQEITIAAPKLHTVARTDFPPSYGGRSKVPDDLVSWDKPFDGYLEARRDFTAPSVLANYPTGWAQAPIIGDVPRDLIRSYGPLTFDESGYPLNPAGRTGFGPGRGLLGCWGANFAADPFVVWRDRDDWLYMLAIVRGDNGKEAFPGGMADKNEVVGSTLKRELGEETGALLDFGHDGILTYAGYVDDFRNGDHSWMETICVMLPISFERAMAMKLRAGDDAKAVLRLKLEPGVIDRLHASHGEIARIGLQKLVDRDSSYQTAVARALSA